MRKQHPNDDEPQQIALVDDQDNEILFNVLLTFHSDDFNRSYILLAPVGDPDNDEIGVQAYALSAEDDVTNPKGGDLLPIESDEEWDMVESVLNTFTDEED